MLQSITAAPPDAILGLTEAFLADPNPDKVNLGVGVYKDASGRTPVLSCVREAQRRLIETEETKSYLPIAGTAAYGLAVRALLFGPDHALTGGGRALTAQTPGGTGALRVGADFLRQFFPGTSVWMSSPTWANHKAVFDAVGLDCRDYPYYNKASHAIDFDAMLTELEKAPAGDVVLLHACCHNPTGADLDAAQWETLARLLAKRDLLPLLDFAYQGFGESLAADRAALLTITEHCPECIVASSFSKNFGLYRDRVGAFTLVASDPDIAQTAFSQVRVCIRSNYSNPPAHGGLVVRTVLEDDALRRQWEEEVDAMRLRIVDMRGRLVEGLHQRGIERDFSFMTRQRGMFSFSGLNESQVRRLREKKSIYIVKGGRINAAGLTPANLDYVCDAVAEVLHA